jgi:hypothetical protein
MSDLPDVNTLFMAAIGVLGGVGSWILNGMAGAIKELRTGNEKISGRIQEIEVVITGQYAKKDEVEKLITALFHKLDKIEDKLDTKMDKNIVGHME